MVIQVNKNGKAVDGPIDEGRKADEDFTTTLEFYNYLSSDGDTELRDDLQNLHFYGDVVRFRQNGGTGYYSRTYEKYVQTDFYGDVQTAYNSGNFIDDKEFQRLLVAIEVEFQVDIFGTVVGYSPQKPPAPAPAPAPAPYRNTQLAGIIAKVTLGNAENNSLNSNEIEIINQLVKYDQDNGKDAEYNNSLDNSWQANFRKNNVGEYHATRLYNVTDKDVRDFGSKNGLKPAEINKVLALTRNWRSEASDDFFKPFY